MTRYSNIGPTAIQHLRKADPVLKDLIRQVGPLRLQLEPDRLQVLVRSIISQQLSTASARTIRERLEALLPGGRWSVEQLQGIDDDALRAVGLSRQKIAYIRDLCEKVESGAIPLSKLGRWKDERIVESLIQVHGIGRWTAQMFLIFSLGRPDVLPVDDLGVRSAVKTLYRLENLPRRDELEQIAINWRPYASVASWYCWRSGELKKQAL